MAARDTAARKQFKTITERSGCESCAACSAFDESLRKYLSKPRTVTMRPREAAIIQSMESAISAIRADNTARFRLPLKMCAMARSTSSGCLVDKSAASAFVTSSVFRYSTSQKKNNPQAIAPTVQRQAIAAKASEGLRKAVRKPSRVGEPRGMKSSVRRGSQVCREHRFFL